MARRTPVGMQQAPAQRKPKENFISRWKSKKEQEIQSIKDQAAADITNDRVTNEQKIIRILQDINFTNPEKCKILVAVDRQSRVIGNKIGELELEIGQKKDLGKPYEDQEEQIRKLLADKANLEENTIRDLVETRDVIIKKLMQPANINVNIKDMDQMLLELANRFASSVRSGNVFGAYAAKAALYNIISEVRYNIPNVPEANLSNYLDESREYINSWINVTTSSANVDDVQRKVNETEAEFGDINRQLLEKKAALRKRVKSDPAYAKAFTDILDDTASKDVSSWSETMKKARQDLVDMRIISVKQKLKFNLLDARKRDLMDTKQQLGVFQDALSLPDMNKDPNLPAKAKEAMEKIYHELAEADRRTEEMLTSLEDIEGQLQMLNEAPGAVKLRETLIKEVENTMKDLQQEQQEELAGNKNAYNRLMKEFGVLSDQEMLDAKNAIIAEEPIENINYAAETITEDEAELNYNED